MADRFEIRTIADLGRLAAIIGTLIPDPMRPFVVEIKRLSSKRSLSANALYWKWLTRMGEYFTTRKQEQTKDTMHTLMRHKFLGYKTCTIGRTEITDLKSTTELDSAEMCHYMQQIDQWAAELGCLLPRPEDNEYAKWLEEEQGKYGDSIQAYSNLTPCKTYVEFKARCQASNQQHWDSRKAA